MGKLKILKSPAAIIFGICIGAFIGIKFKNLATSIKPVGDVYMTFLQMCVIPIMVSAVVTSVGGLVKSKEVLNKIYRIIAVFIISLLVVSISSLGIGMLYKNIIKPNPKELQSIGQIVIENSDGINNNKNGNTNVNSSTGSEDNLNSNSSIIHEIDSRKNDIKKASDDGIVDLLKRIIPSNVFSALSSGDTLKILFFFLVLGVMLKFISQAAYETIMDIFKGIYEAFNRLIGVSMYFLPIGLLALVASQVSGIKGSALSSLLSITVLIYISSALIVLMSVVVIWKFTKTNLRQQIKLFRDVFVITLFTRNSIAAIPSAISGLSRIENLDRSSIDLTIPLGVILFRFGTLMTFSLMTIYAMNVYDVAINASNFILIIGTAILASMATSGAPGIVSKMMIALVLNVLRIPSSAIVVVLIALDPVIDPILTLLNVFPNCAAVAIIAQVKELKVMSMVDEVNISDSTDMIGALVDNSMTGDGGITVGDGITLDENLALIENLEESGIRDFANEAVFKK